MVPALARVGLMLKRTREDPTWKYTTLIDPNDTNGHKCNFCGKKSHGGITRQKEHLIGTKRIKKNIVRCKKVPPEVKEELQEYENEREKQKPTEKHHENEREKQKLTEKHHPPALGDEVWRLENIDKDGSFHKRLNKAEIFTVEDFLRLVVKEPQRLQDILRMSQKKWKSLVEHAKTCDLSGKHYIYYSDETRSDAAVFNSIYEFTCDIPNEQYYAAKCLTDSQKGFVDTLVKKADNNWKHAIEYDGKALLDHNQSMGASTSPNKVPLVSSSSYYQQMSRPQAVQPSLDGGVASGGASSSGGYNGKQIAAYPSPSQPSTSNNEMLFPDASYIHMRNDSTTLVLPQHQSLDFHPTGQLLQPPNIYGGASSSGGYNGNQVDAYPYPSQPSTCIINMPFDDPSYTTPQYTINDSTTLALPQHHSLDLSPMGQFLQPSKYWSPYVKFSSPLEGILMKSQEILENEAFKLAMLSTRGTHLGGAISSGGYNGNQVAAYPYPSQPSTSNINIQFDGPPYLLPLFTRNDSMAATLAPPQRQSLDSLPTGQLLQPSGANSCDDDLFSLGEEIRMRSHRQQRAWRMKEVFLDKEMFEDLLVFAKAWLTVEDKELVKKFAEFLDKMLSNEGLSKELVRAQIVEFKETIRVFMDVLPVLYPAERRPQLVELED